MTDYEKAMRNALKKCYPESKHYACWFHFCQAVKRHASQIAGFAVEIRKNATAREIYCRFLCLPLLPADVIENAFNELRLEAQNYNERFFRPFLGYFEMQWIRNVSRTASNSLIYYYKILKTVIRFGHLIGGTGEYFGV